MILGSVVYLFVPQQRTKYYLAPLDSIALPLCSVWMQLAFCKGNFSKNVFSRFLLRYTTCFWLKRSVFFCVYDLNLVFWSQAYLLGILNLGLLLGLLGLARLSFLWCYLTWYRISANNFCGNYSSLKSTLCVTVHTGAETIQGRKLFAEIRWFFFRSLFWDIIFWNFLNTFFSFFQVFLLFTSFFQFFFNFPTFSIFFKFFQTFFSFFKDYLRTF